MVNDISINATISQYFLFRTIPAMKIILVSLVFIIKNVLSYNISDFYYLPKIYKMENYSNCMAEENVYCELEFDVKFVANETDLWKIFQYSDSKDFLFDRKVLYRAMCLPKLYKNNEAKLKEIGLAKMKNELKLYNLDADLTHIHCKKTFTYKLYDYILLSCLFLYFSWVFVATYIDYFTRSSTNKYVEYFSIVYNYKKLMKENKNKHYVRLKFMQGIRLYAMIGVIWSHSMFSFTSSYIENPELLEENYSHKPNIIISHVSSFLVQIFFVLSGWLSILKIEEDSDNFSKLSVKNVIALAFNRLMRFLPTVWFYLCVWNSNIFFSYDIPITKQLTRYFKNCRNGWFYVFFQNWLYSCDFCNYHLWTISLDIQGFIILSAIFYIIIKYKIPILKCLIALILLFIIIQINVIHFNNFKNHFKLLPRNLLPFTRKHRFFSLHYMSTIANVPSYLIGSIFGIFYLKNTKIVLQRVWLLTSLGLIILTHSLIDIPTSGLTKSIVGGFLKPLFATGFCIFLFGLAQNTSAKSKILFENKIVEALGSCTLSILVFHMCIIFTRCYETHSPVKIVLHEMGLQLIGDVIKSVLVGFVTYLTIEQPFSMLTRWNYKEERNIDKKRKEN